MKKKNAPVEKKEEQPAGMMFRSDADSSINSAAFRNQSQSADELSLSDAMGQNPFKLFCLRTFIKLKNHIAIIPLLFCIIAFMTITFTIYVHVNALVALKNDELNAFWFFINVVLGLVSVLLYINVSKKKTSKKAKIIFSVLFYLVVAGELVLDYLYLHDLNIEVNVIYNEINKVKDEKNAIPGSQGATIWHMVFLGITAVLAALEPVLQPLTKKIHIRPKAKKAEGTK